VHIPSSALAVLLTLDFIFVNNIKNNTGNIFKCAFPCCIGDICSIFQGTQNQSLYLSSGIHVLVQWLYYKCDGWNGIVHITTHSGDLITVGMDFPMPFRPALGPPSLLCSGYQVFCGSKVAKAWCWPLSPLIPGCKWVGAVHIMEWPLYYKCKWSLCKAGSAQIWGTNAHVQLNSILWHTGPQSGI
jgi:hypothetical protein